MNQNYDTLLIADDESSIREGLKCIVDWDELGFTICGEASNGEEALARILALNPGLVLLDVKMPKMLGTEVIRRAREAGFQGKCIILSGYSDFGYAQEAIKSGVRFYLTKPIDEDELYQTVSEIKQELAQEKRHSTHFTELQKKAKSVVLQELLTGILSTPLSDQDLDHFCLTAEVYQVVICEDFHTQAAAAPYTFAELLKVINRDNNIFEHLEINHKDVVLLKGSHGLNRLSDFLERFDNNTAQAGSPLESMFLAYGRPVSVPEDIHLSYADAAALLTRRFFCKRELHAMGYELLPELSANASSSLADPDRIVFTLSESALTEYADRFANYIQSYNRRMTVAVLSELEEQLLYVPCEARDIKLFLTDLYLQIKEKMNRTYASAKIPFSSNSSVLEFMNDCKYLYEIIQFLSKQFEMIMDATGNPSRDTILDDVLYYIDHHFRENIKLETIAPLFGYNSAYLGKIFSKAVGENFNSYVDHRRIEHSKHLLLENQLKVYEIAEQVGYKNVDYFHKKFKKYVGESPAEFRKGQGLDTENGKYPPPQKNAPRA